MGFIILLIMLVCEGILLVTSEILMKFFGVKNKTGIDKILADTKENPKGLTKMYEFIKEDTLALISFYFYTGVNTIYLIALFLGIFFPSIWVSVFGILFLFFYKIKMTNEQKIKFETIDTVMTLFLIFLNLMFLMWGNV